MFRYWLPKEIFSKLQKTTFILGLRFSIYGSETDRDPAIAGLQIQILKVNFIRADPDPVFLRVWIRIRIQVEIYPDQKPWLREIYIKIRVHPYDRYPESR